MYRRGVRAIGPSACGAALVASLFARDARADLPSDVKEVRAGLEADRAMVAAPAPAFLEAGATTFIEPTKLVSSQDACVTVVVLAATTTHFTVLRGAEDESVDDFFAHLHADRDPRQEESVEGLYVHAACNTEVKAMARFAIRMRSTRGTIEVLVARSATVPASLDTLSAERNPGPSAPPTDPGPPLVPRPLEMRKKRSVDREKSRGATDVATIAMTSSETGTGEFDLRVSAGCHAFDVMSDAKGGVDLDAGLRDAGSGALLSSDRGEAPDAHLETCVPEIANLVIAFAGASPSSEVAVSDALFAWPAWITERWTARVASARRTGCARSRDRRWCAMPERVGCGR